MYNKLIGICNNDLKNAYDNIHKALNALTRYTYLGNDTFSGVIPKGGFDKVGNSEDIDIFSPKKFEVLKAYLEKYGLKGGFVRFDKNSDELCICKENYSDDITSDSWKLLDEVF